MTTVIQKWGNSLAVRIPRPLAKDSQLHQGSAVDLLFEKGRIIVQPKTYFKIPLKHLLRKVTKKNLHTEYNWGESRGKEIW